MDQFLGEIIVPRRCFCLQRHAKPCAWFSSRLLGRNRCKLRSFSVSPLYRIIYCKIGNMNSHCTSVTYSMRIMIYFQWCSTTRRTTWISSSQHCRWLPENEILTKWRLRGRLAPPSPDATSLAPLWWWSSCCRYMQSSEFMVIAFAPFISLTASRRNSWCVSLDPTLSV